MFQFILGTVFGGITGVTVMCLCIAAKESDERKNYTDFKD